MQGFFFPAGKKTSAAGTHVNSSENKGLISCPLKDRASRKGLFEGKTV